jgi:SAM-dependent methyltransferase
MSREYPARLYEAVHVGTPGDKQFYREVCRGSKNVLELGCGTGRIGKVLLRDGLPVTGIDNDKECVEISEELGIKTHLADIRDFQLNMSFDRIIAPYNVLYSLLDDNSVVQCFKKVELHLQENGEFWFDGYSVEALHRSEPIGDNRTETVEMVATIKVDGTTYDVIESGKWDSVSQLVQAEYRHVPRDRSEVITTEIPQRYLRTDQIPTLLERAGLGISKWYGNFNREAPLPESDHIVVCAQRMD